MGEQIQIQSDPHGRLSAGLLPLCGAESGSRTHDSESRVLCLVKLSAACRPRSRVDWLDRNPCYEGLGELEAERAKRYREFVRSGIPAGEWDLIREALQRGQLTGNARFADEIEAIIGRRIENRKQDRPRTQSEEKICPLLFSFSFRVAPPLNGR